MEERRHIREAEAEKVTINLGFVDLGHIDLLVRECFYANRSDFIRTAIRNQISHHRDVLPNLVARQPLTLGLRRVSRDELERARAAGQTLEIRTLGLLSIDEDVTAQLARETITSISVLGAFHASPALRAALSDRIR